MTTHAEPEPLILDAELVDDLMTPQPLRVPATVGPTYAELVETGCVCGNATNYGHGGFTCDEVLNIRARVTYSQLSFWRRLRTPKPAGWRLSKAEIVQIIERDRARRRAEVA